MDIKKNDTSLYLDLLRALSAQTVCVVHAFNWFYYPYGGGGAYTFLAWLAVQVFFLLSGFLIAYTLTQKESEGFTNYAIDRSSRIYSAYAPAILLVLAIDYVLILFGRYDFSDHFTLKAFVANLFMLQHSSSAIPTFGSADPFWTIYIEFFAYIFVGALFFLRTSKHYVPLLLIALVFGTQMSFERWGGLFTLWLMGFAVFFLVKGKYLQKVPSWVLVGFAGVALWYVVKRFNIASGYESRFYPIFAFIFFVIATVSSRTKLLSSIGIVRKSVSFLASYSYSLYLIHFTIIYAMMKFWQLDNFSGVVTGVLLSNVLAYGFYYVTERNHKKLSGWIKATYHGLREWLVVSLSGLRGLRTRTLRQA